MNHKLKELELRILKKIIKFQDKLIEMHNKKMKELQKKHPHQKQAFTVINPTDTQH